jgi:hypothetical protein
MVKETSIKSTTSEKPITFKCRFCGETQSFDEMVLLTRYFPVLTACRACDKELQNKPFEVIPECCEPPVDEEEQPEE